LRCQRARLYTGTTNGLNAASEIPLKLTVDGATLTLEASAESRLGDVVLTCASTGRRFS